MIVRIQGEGQYELDDGRRAHLDELDSRLFSAIDANDSGAFAQGLRAAVEYIESQGSRLPDDRLVPSDIILPSSDTSLDEAKRLFTDEGYLQPVDA